MVRRRPLYYAIKYNKEKAIELLLEHGAAPKYPSSSLYLLCYMKISDGSNMHIIDALLQIGINPLRTSGDFKSTSSPLIIAINKNLIDVAKLMINRCIGVCDIRLIGRHLRISVEMNRTEIAKLLLEDHRININHKRRSNGDTIIHTVINKKNKDLLLHIISKHNIDTSRYNFKRHTLFHKAIITRQYDILEELLRIDLDVSKRMIQMTEVISSVESCVHMAARRGDIKALDVMLPYITDMNLLDHDQNTPIQVAKGEAIEWLTTHS